MGKLAISQVILDKEKKSKLNIRNIKNNYNFETYSNQKEAIKQSIQKSWINPFAKMLFSSVAPDQVFKNVYFVNFNYDRCLEEALFLPFQDYFDLSDQDAFQVLYGDLCIIRFTGFDLL
jgi:hypothetical protein